MSIGREVVRHREQPYRRRPGNVLNLPEGKTCGDCIHIYRCNAIFGHQVDDEVCDWDPILFVSRTDESQQACAEGPKK